MGFANLETTQQALIKAHLQAVIEINHSINLTRIDSPEQAFLLHIEDSLSALPELSEAPDGLYGDLGSGGGFPGVPLAIATGRETYLIDMRQKKMAAITRVIQELGLQNQIHTYTGRAELLAHVMPEAFTALTARALAKLPVLLELASPLLQKNGVLISYKSHLEDIEYKDAQRVSELVGMKLIHDRTFVLKAPENVCSPNQTTSYQRRLLTFQKATNPKVKLPRSEGTAQKTPF